MELCPVFFLSLRRPFSWFRLNHTDEIRFFLDGETAPFWDVFCCFSGAQLSALWVKGIVKLFYLQDFLSTQDDQRIVQGQAEDFIGSQKLSLADGTGLPVFRGIVGNPPGIQLLGLVRGKVILQPQGKEFFT